MSDDERSKDLEVYLQDHYAGGVRAIELLEHLIKTHDDQPLGRFCTELHADVTSDHEQLRNLINALGFEESRVRNAGAWMAEKLGRAKLGFPGGETASLRLVQAFETLLLGITGKQLLWRSMSAVSSTSPVLQRTDFTHLEKRALEQIERVEAKRVGAARAAFRAS